MRIVRSLLLVLLVCCFLFFGALIRSRTWGRRFTGIRPGDTSGAVQERAGTPTRTMACAALSEPPDACRSVLVYAGPFSAVMPEFWLVPLAGDGRVLRVFHTTRADR